MSAADRLEDSFPHGTVDGFKAGCRGVICPAAVEHGLSCQRAKQLAAGDYEYQKLARRGASPAEISEALGLHPQIHRPAPKKVVVPDDEFEIDEPEEAPVEPKKVPTPKDVAPKPKAAPKPKPAPKPKRKTPDGPSQSEVRAWARENGLDVNPRGSVRSDVVRAYLAAHAPILSKVKDAAADCATPTCGYPEPHRHGFACEPSCPCGLGLSRPEIPPMNIGMRREFTGPDTSPDEVLVEGSWFKRDELPTILGNYMRTADEYARQVKDITITVAEPAPAPEADAAAYTALELVLRKWAAEKDRADALQRALDDERARLGSFARMLSSYQVAATADGEHIASLDEQIRDLTDKVELLSIPWWQRRAS